MPKPKFDSGAAFRNIIGTTDADGDTVVAAEVVTETTGEAAIAPQSIAAGAAGPSPTTVNSMISPAKREETRSRRVNFVIKPSVYDMARNKCDKMGISLNECINQFLEKWSKE